MPPNPVEPTGGLLQSTGRRKKMREIAGGKTPLQIGHNRALGDLNPEEGSRALA